MLKRSWCKSIFIFVSADLSLTMGFAPSRLQNTRAALASSSALSMCICIDCARVTNCAAYHFVESKHEQPHMNEKPTFEPVNGRYVFEYCTGSVVISNMFCSR